jgi:hypothetical protein
MKYDYNIKCKQSKTFSPGNILKNSHYNITNCNNYLNQKKKRTRMQLPEHKYDLNDDITITAIKTELISCIYK